MAVDWPVAEFRDYLQQLMREAGIADYSELSRLTGVSPSQFSNWHNGRTQPSQANLRRIAPTLSVLPMLLYLAAGLNQAEEFGLEEKPDMRVIPREIQGLLDLFDTPGLTDDQLLAIRRSVAILEAGLRAELGISSNNPDGRGRVA